MPVGGYCTTDWTAATTLPGWSVESGSPDVVCSSAGSFGYPSGVTPDAAFYAPGDQGDGTVEQTVDMSSAGTAIDAGTVTYNLSALLGGWTAYAGYVQVSLEFRNASGTAIGATADLLTVGESQRGGKTEFLSRSLTGAVPAGTRSIPRTDGVRRQLERGRLRRDENYMAIAGGDTYATGATYWPNNRDPNKNIGDELTAAGKSWKAYEQGMGTPCNTTTRYDSYYGPDDAPFIKYTDVANNAAYCQAHLFDTSQLTTDL